MTFDPTELADDVLAFLRERHLATLTTLRANGSPHVVAVGFTFDQAAGLVRVITSDGSVKVRNAERPAANGAAGRAAVCQVDGRRWLTLEGVAAVSRDRTDVQEAERRYGLRYRVPRINPRRVVLSIAVDRMLGHT
ncbi:MAG: TIGR03618 family F420-dependent PPOX class oxidoreductase [Nakamurella sp.]